LSSFSAEWLDLREPADARARSRSLTQAVADALPRNRQVDLACGTGSNVRYLTPFLRSPRRWLLADHSETLLGVARERCGLTIATRVVDLAREVNLPALVAGQDLVTASALLDLVSDDWLRHAVSACRQAGSLVLFALSYDGRMSCAPVEEHDTLVRDLVNRHQRTDKGFGPALGPDAAARVIAHLEGAGYRVRTESSDWVLDADTDAMQRLLVDGWAAAAIEIEPSSRADVERWHRNRITHIDAGRSEIVVGHQDVAGVL
jgi:SAM-dependent methyltransferase